MKKCMDLFLAFILLAVLSPVLLVLVLLVRIKLGSPVFFVQDRPGYKGRIFKMIKFRTMTDERDSAGQLFPDAQRLTPFGQFLRRTSLDELPELINVLKGEMSFVGPRPLLVEYLPLYTAEQKRRHDVLPGITGLAQISGRNNLEWDKRFELDVYYVDNRSLMLDFKILWLTVGKVLLKKDISQEGHATAPAFTGSKENRK